MLLHDERYYNYYDIIFLEIFKHGHEHDNTRFFRCKEVRR